MAVNDTFNETLYIFWVSQALHFRVFICHRLSDVPMLLLSLNLHFSTVTLNSGKSSWKDFFWTPCKPEVTSSVTKILHVKLSETQKEPAPQSCLQGVEEIGSFLYDGWGAWTVQYQWSAWGYTLTCRTVANWKGAVMGLGFHCWLQVLFNRKLFSKCLPDGKDRMEILHFVFVRRLSLPLWNLTTWRKIDGWMQRNSTVWEHLL